MGNMNHINKLFVAFTAVAMLFTSCENSSTDSPNGGSLQLNVTSSKSIWFEADGGVGEIRYELTEPTRSDAVSEVDATCDADWISNIQVADTITFTVAPNGGDAERVAYIVVSYGVQQIEVKVSQTFVEVQNFVATHAGGSYFGKLQTRGFNYFVILSDMQPSAISSIPGGASQYRFDIYSSQTSAFNRIHKIPVGTYTLDNQGTGEPGTIDGNVNRSAFYAPYERAVAFRACTLVVTEDSIVADIALIDGSVHHVEYHGSLVMEDYSEMTYTDVFPLSALTADTTFDVDGGYIYAYYRGDYYGTGCDVWFLHMIENKSNFSGVYLMMDLIVPKSLGGWDNNSGFLGEFSLLDPTSGQYEYTFPGGFIRDDSNQLHCWYMTCINGQIDMSQSAPIIDGTIVVEGDSRNLSITIDGVDDAGNKISGTFAGLIGEFDNQAHD